jgi:transcriptional regulator NrdR family protein
MVCIYCGAKTQVINSRSQKRLKQVWRRRKCLACSNIFSTIERINFSNTLLITTRSGKVDDFSKEKLLLSIYDSLKHRRDALDDAIAITDTVMAKVLETLKTPLIDHNTLINISTEVLKRFDKPAAVHYSAYNPVKKNN